MTDLAEETARVHQLVPILGAMGIEVTRADRGQVACRLPAGPNVNHFGVSYAGSLFSAAEMLGGVIAGTTFPLEGFIPLVKKLEITFLKPAGTAVVASTGLEEEEIARIEAEAIERGKADFVLRTEVVDESGVVVARTEGLYQLRRM